MIDRPRFRVLASILAVLAGTGIASAVGRPDTPGTASATDAARRLAVFQAAGPGDPEPSLLAAIDAAVRRSVVLGLPAEGWTTLMAGPAAPGCTGRCAVARAAEYGARLGLAVRVAWQGEENLLRLRVYAAPEGVVLAERAAAAREPQVLVDLAGIVADDLARALTGEAPARVTEPRRDPDADRVAAAEALTALRALAGRNTVGMQLHLVEPGRPFHEPPPDQAYIQARPLPEPAMPYLLATTEVTRAQWEVVMAERAPGPPAAADTPVVGVNWMDAVRFCNALSRCEGLEPAYDIGRGTATWRADADGYRLPTDAEWEYACRAGSLTMFTTGGRSDDLARTAWYARNSDGRPREVGGKQANAWGFFDMHGNVWEWIWDAYATLPDLSPDNVESPGLGPDRTIRGGSWYTGPIACRTTNFCRIDPVFRSQDLGLRVARTPRADPR